MAEVRPGLAAFVHHPSLPSLPEEGQVRPRLHCQEDPAARGCGGLEAGHCAGCVDTNDCIKNQLDIRFIDVILYCLKKKFMVHVKSSIQRL